MTIDKPFDTSLTNPDDNNYKDYAKKIQDAVSILFLLNTFNVLYVFVFERYLTMPYTPMGGIGGS